MKKKVIISTFLLVVSLLSSCSGTSNNTTSSNSSIESRSSSSKASSAEVSSVLSSSNSSVSSEVSSLISSSDASYKKVNLYVLGYDDEISVEIPIHWELKDASTLIPSPEIGDWLSFYFSIDDTQVYPDNYFETLQEGNTMPVSLKKVGAPSTNQYHFSLTDGTSVYITADGAAGTSYVDYEFIKDGKKISLHEVTRNAAIQGSVDVLTLYSDEELIHILSSLSL